MRAGLSLGSDMALAAALYAALLLGVLPPAASGAMMTICSVSLPGGGKATPDTGERRETSPVGHCAGMAAAATGPVSATVTRPIPVRTPSARPAHAGRPHAPVAIRRVARGPPAAHPGFHRRK